MCSQLANFVRMTDYSEQVVWKMNRQLHEWIQHTHNCNRQKTEMSVS